MIPPLARERVDRVLVAPETPIERAIEVLDRAGLGVLVVAGEDRRLEAVITDGDVRRAVLRHQTLDAPCRTIASPDPLVAPADVGPKEALRLMDRGKPFLVDHLPLVDRVGIVQGLLLRRDLMPAEAPAMCALVMAGGYGRRLRPLTSRTPKPMLPVGDRPLLQRTVEQLAAIGIRQVSLATHYRAEVIEEHFGDGTRFGVDIDYLREDVPEGTAGALRRLRDAPGPILVINGDVLTGIDFAALHRFHREHRADLTLGLREYEVRVPYGVVETRNERVTGIAEKPSLGFFVNAGIYLVEPALVDDLPPADAVDMSELIERAVADGRRVVAFPIRESWIDIGQHEDYERAQREVGRNRPAASEGRADA